MTVINSKIEILLTIKTIAYAKEKMICLYINTEIKKLKTLKSFIDYGIIIELIS